MLPYSLDQEHWTFEIKFGKDSLSRELKFLDDVQNRQVYIFDFPSILDFRLNN